MAKPGVKAHQAKRVKLKLKNLPMSYHMQAGGMGVMKGRRDLPSGQRMQMYAWDATTNCLHEECPAIQYCPKRPDPDNPNQKCKVQLHYVKQVANVMFNTYADADEVTQFQIGMHLIPMYSNLARLKIAELGVRRVTYIANSGAVKLHPIYKELRETHVKLIKAFQDIGLTDVTVTGLADIPIIPDKRKGDVSLYDRMMKSAQGDRRK